MGGDESLDLRQLLTTLRRRLRLLIAVPAIAAVAAAILSAFIIPPTYSASTTLWVVKKEGTGQLDYNSLLLSRDITKTYAQVAQSQTVAEATIRKLGLQVEPQNLLQRVTVTPVRDTEILQIVVEDRSPEQAANIANTIAQQFMAELPKFMTLDNVRVVDRAQPPRLPVRPRKLLNTAVAFVLGLMAAVGGAVLLESLDVTMRTPDDVQRHLGLPVLGMVPVIESETPTAEARTRRARPAPATVNSRGTEPK